MKKSKEKKRFFSKIYPRKIDWLDLTFIKISSISASFFLITFSQTIQKTILEIHWAWFLAFAALFSYRPLIKSEYLKE